MYDAMAAETVKITGHGGDEVEAYLAYPRDPGPLPGVVVIHHMPGYDEWTKEVVRKFAVHGYTTICPNLHYREAPGAAPDDAAAASRAAGGVPDDRAVGDVDGAIRHLKSLGSSNGKVGVIGHCSGGRQAFLVACSLDIDAAVDCHGGAVVRTAPAGYNMPSLMDRTPSLSCPLLGLFGADDNFPTPEENAELEAELKKHGKTYEFHTYEGAGHALFATHRVSYRVEAANDGYQRIFTWFGRYLGN